MFIPLKYRVLYHNNRYTPMKVWMVYLYVSTWETTVPRSEKRKIEQEHLEIYHKERIAK